MSRGQVRSGTDSAAAINQEDEVQLAITPEKKLSIGLTPVQQRLLQLRLSSGVRSSPKPQRVSQLERSGVRRKLFCESDEEVKGNTLRPLTNQIVNSTGV